MDYKPTHTCCALTAKDEGQEVKLSGWVHRRRDHGGLIFIDLRDLYGLTQLVFDPKISKSAHSTAEKLRSEFVLTAKGKVKLRGEGLTNPKLYTGEIEIAVDEISILSLADTPPFSITDEETPHEDLRLTYRFLDIRRGKIAKNLQLRDKVMHITRNFLHDLRFYEIQTPILAKTMPEGSRDYLVPSRIYPGKFYALPQSPQIFKQILMIAGMDRYYQIATCIRDEDLRADRQPEFSQIDIEMSFMGIEDLFSITEDLISQIFKSVLQITLQKPFPKLTYHEAMEKYGTDKPDLRFGMSFVQIDDLILSSNFSLLKSVIESGGICKAFTFPKGASLSRREIDEFNSFVTPFGLNGLAWIKKKEGKLQSNVCKFFSEEQLIKLEHRLSVDEGDLILIAAEKSSIVNQALDHLRRHIAKKWNLIPENSYAFTWIVDFPLFQWDEKEKQIESESHPFTSPHEDDLYLLDSEPLKVRSHAYDLVLNGYELGSGSQRINDSTIQAKIFQILRLSKEELQRKFGFFLNALKYGTPPHLGIALGVERLIMVLAQTDNIRDVIAFPKTQSAADLMMQAPSEANPKLLKELHIQTKK